MLCTATATYDLKHVETTNALLLVAPQQVRICALANSVSTSIGTGKQHNIHWLSNTQVTVNTAS